MAAGMPQFPVSVLCKCVFPLILGVPRSAALLRKLPLHKTRSGLQPDSVCSYVNICMKKQEAGGTLLLQISLFSKAFGQHCIQADRLARHAVC